MKMVVGVDEAGRGPLAGPVAVGVVACAKDFDILTAFPGLNDSKKLSEKKRETLFKILQEEIMKGNVRATVHLSSPAMIDAEGMTYAVRHALTLGVRKLAPDPVDHFVYLDGSLYAPEEYAQETVVGGDALIPAIMLASVVAKVSRDKRMQELAKEYPQYGFEVHKGYGTKAHFAAITEHGACPIHRQLFLRKFFEAGKA